MPLAARRRAPACKPRSPTSCSSPTAAVGDDRRSRCPRASGSCSARGAGRAAPAIYVPGGRAPLPSHASSWASSPRAPPASRRSSSPRRRPCTRSSWAPRAVRRHRGLRDGRRPRGRGARLRDGGGRARRRHRRPRQPLRQEAKRQVSGTWASTASTAPATSSSSPTGPPTRALIALDLLAQAEHGPETVVARDVRRPRAAGRRRRAGRRARGRPPDVRSGGHRARRRAVDERGAGLRRGVRARAPRARRARPPSAWRRACAPPAAIFVGRARRDRLRRLRRRLEPLPADGRRRALRVGPLAAACSAAA